MMLLIVFLSSSFLMGAVCRCVVDVDVDVDVDRVEFRSNKFC
jgi:hypothetical protein